VFAVVRNIDRYLCQLIHKPLCILGDQSFHQNIVSARRTRPQHIYLIVAFKFWTLVVFSFATKFGSRLCPPTFHHFIFNPDQLLYVFIVRGHSVVGVFLFKCVFLISTGMKLILRFKIYRFKFCYFWTTTRWHVYAWWSASMIMSKELLKISTYIF